MKHSRLQSLAHTISTLSELKNIALKDDNFIHGDQMADDILSVINQIRKTRTNKIALYFNDSYLFSISLIALLCSNKSPIILPNIQPEFINSISVEIDHILSDTLLDTNVLSTHINTPPNSNNGHIAEQLLIPNDVELIIFTSGSSGSPKKIIKTLHHLESEFITLEKLWGSSIDQSIIRSTVSHQHIYGLIFRLLWPLCSNRCFDATTYQYPEKLLEKILSTEDNILISSPAHLKRIPELVDLSACKSRLHYIFSSGGPLDNYTALKISSLIDYPVTEIFGSSETGGIAYRQQTHESSSQDWQVFSGIKIKTNPDDNSLIIHSPFEGSNDWYHMKDTASINPDKRSFKHLARTDNIVKIEEKRLSLTELERQLKLHSLVKDCAATVITGKRNTIAIVVVLNEEGTCFLEASNKLALNKLLKTHLMQYFEPVVLPRKWRYTDSLPENNQGKTTQLDLQAMFTKTTESPKSPDLISVNNISKNEIELSLQVPEDLHYFKGHYPEQPIVPGVVEIDWAIKYGIKHFNITSEFKGMEVVKFHKLIVPNDKIKLHLSYNQSNNKLIFSFTSESDKLSSGRIIFS